MTLKTTAIALTRERTLRRGDGLLQRFVDRFGVLGCIASGILAVIVIAAAGAPWLAPYDPNTPDLLSALSGPSAQHLLGTDAVGRDLLSRLMWGAQITLIGPTLIIVTSTVIGTALALIAAWSDRRVDAVIVWILDILFSIPGIVFGLIAVTLWGPSLFTVSAGLAVAYVPYVARVVRGSALRERSMPYISAAWLQGESGPRIMLTQILPNVQPIVIAQAVSSLGFAVIDLASMSFLGLGVQPPTADLGFMVKDGFDSVLRGAPAEAISAGVLIALIVWCVTVIGDRLTSTTGGVR